jgi:hypothetical protein
MFCLASCAAFCRSAKLGSLNPLIERALSLSLAWCETVGFAGRVDAALGAFPRSESGVQPRGPGSHQLIG